MITIVYARHIHPAYIFYIYRMEALKHPQNHYRMDI